MPFGAVQKDAIIFFIFMGGDAEASCHGGEKQEAMRQFAGQLTKYIFGEWGYVRGFLVANSFSLGKIFNTEVQLYKKQNVNLCTMSYV